MNLIGNKTLKEKVRYLISHHQEFENFEIIENALVQRQFRSDYRLDFLLEPFDSNLNPRIGIIVKDWNRSIGYRVIIYIEKILKSTRKLDKILLVGTFFSEPAQIMAKKLNIPLLTSGELITILSLEEKQTNIILPLIERITKIN